MFKSIIIYLKFILSLNLSNMNIQNYKKNLIDFYINYDNIIDRLEKKNDNLELDSYQQKKLLLFNIKIERINDELKEFELELKSQKSFISNTTKIEIKKELEDLNLYYTIMNKLSPITLSLIDYYTQNKKEFEYMYCKLCNKKFKGYNYLERCQQHLKDKHI